MADVAFSCSFEVLNRLSEKIQHFLIERDLNSRPVNIELMSELRSLLSFSRINISYSGRYYNCGCS